MAKNVIVTVPTIKKPIQPSPGFDKKQLSDHKLDIMGLCGFGCTYCSSNSGNYLRINREPFADLTEQQLGRRAYPAQDPDLTFVWPDVIPHLERQLAGKPKTWGAGRTLVFSMQTDPFSPVQLADGTTERALTLVLERTAFRVRVLTKNAVVGRGRWVDFFVGHPGRFVVGLSTGTLDDEWARRVEVGTSSPSGRLEALGNLQRAGVPTYGMLCPVFPDVIFSGRLDELVDRVSPAAVEAVWAEPFNDRDNWQKVRDSYPEGSAGREWLTEVYGLKNRAAWSRYATELYRRLRGKARGEGWLPKLKYLLYEDMITEEDAGAFTGLEGVLLQSKPGPEGLSRNRHIASLQRARVTERR